VTLLATLLTLLILLGTFLDLMIGTAAALAKLWRCAVCHRMSRLPAIEAALLTRLAGLSLFLVFALTLAFALVILALTLAFALVILALAFSLALAWDRTHVLPIVGNLVLLVLPPVVVVDLIPCVGLAILGIDALLFRHCK